MVDCNVARTANLVNGGFAFARNDWAAESTEKPFRRVDREQSYQELGVRLDERQRERERVARELHDSLLVPRPAGLPRPARWPGSDRRNREVCR